MTATFETNIKTNKRTLTIVFLCFWLLFATSYLINKQTIKGTEYLLVIGSVFAFLYLLWMCFGSIRLILSADKLIVEKKVFSLTYLRETYNLKNIDNIYKRTNDDANTSWDHGLIVDKNPIVIYFDFHKQPCKIGEGLEEFNADQIISEIKARKKAAPNNGLLGSRATVENKKCYLYKKFIGKVNWCFVSPDRQAVER